MIIECPQCKATYDVEGHIIGKNVRCTHCTHVWRAAAKAPPPPPPAEPEVEASVGVGGNTAVGEGAESTDGISDEHMGVQEGHGARAEPRPAMAAGSEQAQSQADPQFQSDPRPEATTVAVQRPQAQPISGKPQPPAAPVVRPPAPASPPGGEAPRLNGWDPAHADAVGRRELEMEPHRPPQGRGGFEAFRPGGQRPGQAGSEPVRRPARQEPPFPEGPAISRDPLNGTSRPGHGSPPPGAGFDDDWTVAGKNTAPPQGGVGAAPAGGASRGLVLAGWLAILAAVGGVLVTAVLAPERMVRLLPGTAAIYAAMGVPVNVRGLEFSNLGYRWAGDNAGRPALEIAGEVTNITTEPLIVPTVVFALLDEDGLEIFHWATVIRRSALPPGKTTRFQARIPAPPEAVRGLQVHFATER